MSGKTVPGQPLPVHGVLLTRLRGGERRGRTYRPAPPPTGPRSGALRAALVTTAPSLCARPRICPPGNYTLIRRRGPRLSPPRRCAGPRAPGRRALTWTVRAQRRWTQLRGSLALRTTSLTTPWQPSCLRGAGRRMRAWCSWYTCILRGRGGPRPGDQPLLLGARVASGCLLAAGSPEAGRRRGYGAALAADEVFRVRPEQLFSAVDLALKGQEI